ncbi:FAD binding domain-containing protein [Nesterenkonia sp. CL21]|uniref:xanthine dehydrogenase small subunit n=1 Tax=Nesterenkonia sp. CL21 TaxID=3064894 RepID=UPI00287AD6C4|nr:FAD binding domain-containing protein [Nesterenkonia sp. CL21]MDS2174121.1 FAD binding domain-containing protein [Nesterenkonia sp. CL21]
MTTNPIRITVNARERVQAAPPRMSLLDWLRGLGLTGAKEGCAEGECGACAVLVARPDGGASVRWTAVNSCLPPAAALDGQEIVTAEGLADGADGLHPVQQEMAQRGGSQCGYCTPGFICSMAAEFYRPERRATGDDDADEGVDGSSGVSAPCGDSHGPNGFDLHALSGNLCRCTGYRPIRDAAYALGRPHPEDPLARRCASAAPAAATTSVAAEDGWFLRPATLAEALDRLAQDPETVVIAGATDLGVERNIRHARPRSLLAIDHLPELQAITWADDAVEIGAAATLSEIERTVSGRVPLVAQLLPQFASRLIRNSATLGGNLGTASPIGDAAPALLALDAELDLVSADGRRTVPLKDFFTGYRQTVRTAGELIRAVRIPLPLQPHTAFHKIAKRRFDDISSVAVAYAVTLRDGHVDDVRIGLGGVAATPLRALAAEDALRGREWTPATVDEAASVLRAEGTPMDDLRASADYRAEMLAQSLHRFLAEREDREDRPEEPVKEETRP